MKNPDLELSDAAIDAYLRESRQIEAIRLLDHQIDLFKQLCVALLRRDGIESLTPENRNLITRFVKEAIPIQRS